MLDGVGNIRPAGNDHIELNGVGNNLTQSQRLQQKFDAVAVTTERNPDLAPAGDMAAFYAAFRNGGELEELAHDVARASDNELETIHDRCVNELQRLDLDRIDHVSQVTFDEPKTAARIQDKMNTGAAGEVQEKQDAAFKLAASLGTSRVYVDNPADLKSVVAGVIDSINQAGGKAVLPKAVSDSLNKAGNVDNLNDIVVFIYAHMPNMDHPVRIMVASPFALETFKLDRALHEQPTQVDKDTHLNMWQDDFYQGMRDAILAKDISQETLDGLKAAYAKIAENKTNRGEMDAVIGREFAALQEKVREE